MKWESEFNKNVFIDTPMGYLFSSQVTYPIIGTESIIQVTTTTTTLSQWNYYKVNISDFTIFYVKYKDLFVFIEPFKAICASAYINAFLLKKIILNIMRTRWRIATNPRKWITPYLLK